MTLCYFCNHPYPLVIFDTIARIAKAGGIAVRHQLLLSKHPYFEDLEYGQFTESFDQVDMIPYVNARRNILAGLLDARRYLHALDAIRLQKDSVFFTISYSDLATNLFCSRVKRIAPDAKLVHLTIYGNFLDVSSGRFSLTKTIRDFVYSVALRARFMSTYADGQGVVLEKTYWRDPHTKTYQLTFPAGNTSASFEQIPFPLISASNSSGLKIQRVVFFFGDGTLESSYPELDRNVLYGTINRVLSYLRGKYRGDPGVKIYYKPHPLDRGRVPPEVNLDGIEVYQGRLSAEMILLQPGMEVLETYSVSSTACLTASHFGIPSYGFYRICGFPDYVVVRFAGHFKTANPACFAEVHSWEQLETAGIKKVEIDRSSIQAQWMDLLGRLTLKQPLGSQGRHS